jgi:outer membrane protein
MSFRSFFAGAIAALPLLLPTVARAELKIGYVDLQRALLEVEEGRAAKAKLQGVLDSKQKEMLDKQASAMSEETRVSKQTELQKKLFDLAQRWEKGKQEMANRERTELQAIFQKMDPIIASIAQREGFTLVFEKTDSGLVYAPQSLDLTNELVRLYNDQHKGGKGSVTTTPKTDAPKKQTTVASDPKSDVPKQ